MDRIINSNTEKQTIYEIYRACRLCGAGAGYKMPIIQNVVDLDASGIELTQKIRDCVQIEVHPDDKMPPLICELCVDKVNDFYEFVELCQRTNKRTRMRLGLPPQNPSRVPSSDASSNSGDCILGVTEPVYQNDDSDEPLAPVTRRSKQPEVKKVKMPAGRRMASVKMDRTGNVIQEINRRRCINCSLAVPRNMLIHTVENVHNKIREVLNSWVTPTLVTAEHIICHDCYLLLQEGTIGSPEVGHQSVCFGCGVSLLRTKGRTYQIKPEFPQRNVFLQWTPAHLVSRLERACAACYRAAIRIVDRQQKHDRQRPAGEEVQTTNEPPQQELPLLQGVPE